MTSTRGTVEPETRGRTEDMADYEAVSPRGLRYNVPRSVSRAFAVHMKVKDDHNFPRAMDPHHDDHQFVEGWQGVHNVRFLEKLDGNGAVVGFELIWGQPKHTMRQFYDHVRKTWPELNQVKFDTTFCRTLARKPTAKLPGFRVAVLSLDDTRARLPLGQIPVEVGSPSASAASPAGEWATAAPSVGAQMGTPLATATAHPAVPLPLPMAPNAGPPTQPANPPTSPLISHANLAPHPLPLATVALPTISSLAGTPSLAAPGTALPSLVPPSTTPTTPYPLPPPAVFTPSLAPVQVRG